MFQEYISNRYISYDAGFEMLTLINKNLSLPKLLLNSVICRLVIKLLFEYFQNTITKIKASNK